MLNWRRKKETVDATNKTLRQRLDEELETKGQEATYFELKEKYDSLEKWATDFHTRERIFERDNKYNLRLIRKLEEKVLNLGGTREDLKQIDNEVYEELKTS